MKKPLITALTAILILTNFTACDVQTDPPPAESPSISSTPESPSISSTPESSNVSDTPESSNVSDTPESSAPESDVSNVPEPQKPEGEPTFLTAPDGTPIYTSEITSYQNKIRESEYGFEIFPLDTFNLETFTDVDLTFIVCDGFAYAFTPRPNISVSDNPDKFTEANGIYTYTGDDFQPSREYFRLKVGDKFGSLTVKSAQARFSNYEAQGYDGDPAGIPGIYLTGAEIKYEGEVEMTGFIGVAKTEGYNTEGDLWFYPEGDCVSQIPAADYHFVTSDPGAGVHHCASSAGYVYGELNTITLGNMYDFGDVDFDGLQPGDRVRVKITIKDPVAGYSWGSPWCEGEPAHVEVLDR